MSADDEATPRRHDYLDDARRAMRHVSTITDAAAVQAMATIALVEEQRTANLLTIWQARGAFADDWPDDPESGELLDGILRRLGLRS